MKIDIHKKFLNYAEKMEDFSDGECIVDVCHCDELIIGAMLESYFVYAYQLALKDYKKELKEQAAKEEFLKHQPKLFDDMEEKSDEKVL